MTAYDVSSRGPPVLGERQLVAANLCIATACGVALDDWVAGVVSAMLLFALSHSDPHEHALLAIW